MRHLAIIISLALPACIPGPDTFRAGHGFGSDKPDRVEAFELADRDYNGFAKPNYHGGSARRLTIADFDCGG